jgi:probable HAF family extracellular repeat protein
VVGYANHAWLWQSGGAITDLNTLLPANSGWVLGEADGINDSQQIVGQGIINGQYHAFLWQIQQLAGSPAGIGTPTDLGTLPGVASSGAKAINNTGQVAGWSNTPPPNQDHAVLWTSGQINDLGSLPNDNWSTAYALNNSSQVQVVGSSYHSSYRAVLWQSGTVTDLNSQLPKKSAWSLLENAYGINDAGQIVGEGQVASGPHHAFLLTPTSRKTAAALDLAPRASNPLGTGQLALPAAPTAGPAAPSAPPASQSVVVTAPGIWTLTFTINLAPGTYTVYAQAEDNYGVFGDPVSIPLPVL